MMNGSRPLLTATHSGAVGSISMRVGHEDDHGAGPLVASPLAERVLTKALEVVEGGTSTLLLPRAAEASTWPGVDPIEEQIRVVDEAQQYLNAVQVPALRRLVGCDFR